MANAYITEDPDGHPSGDFDDLEAAIRHAKCQAAGTVVLAIAYEKLTDDRRPRAIRAMELAWKADSSHTANGSSASPNLGRVL